MSRKVPFDNASEKMKTIDYNVYEFSLESLVMQKGTWEMRTKINHILDLINREYRITLVLNLLPFDEAIEAARERMRSHGQLEIDGTIPSEDEYNSLIRQREEIIRICEDISLNGTVIKSKYADGKTFIDFLISPEIINILNDHRDYLENYNIKLEAIV